jgi:hypothetical protein
VPNQTPYKKELADIKYSFDKMSKSKNPNELRLWYLSTEARIHSAIHFTNNAHKIEETQKERLEYFSRLRDIANDLKEQMEIHLKELDNI